MILDSLNQHVENHLILSSNFRVGSFAKVTWCDFLSRVFSSYNKFPN